MSNVDWYSMYLSAVHQRNERQAQLEDALDRITELENERDNLQDECNWWNDKWMKWADMSSELAASIND